MTAMIESDYGRWWTLANLAHAETHGEPIFCGYNHAIRQAHCDGTTLPTDECIARCEGRMADQRALDATRGEADNRYGVGYRAGCERALTIMRGEGV